MNFYLILISDKIELELKLIVKLSHRYRIKIYFISSFIVCTDFGLN